MQRLLSIAITVFGLIVLLGVSAQCAGKEKAPWAERSRSLGADATTGQKASPPETDFLASLEAKEKKAPEIKAVPVYKTAFGLIFKLALVLGLVYLTVLGLKKFTSLKAGPVRPGQHIRVLENSMLAANRSLHIVEIGSRKIVIGSTPSQVSMIAELPEEPQEEPAPSRGPGWGSVPAEDSSFRNHLVSMMSKGGAAAPPPQGKRPPVERETARTVAQMLRESNEYLQDKVRDVGTIRGKVRD